jgi:putative transcriptional regulator
MKNTVKIERRIMAITQEEFAKQVGVSRQTISAIEANKYIPSALLALKMAKIFGKRVNDFFFLEDSDW